MDCPNLPPSIVSFRDALGFAMELSAHHQAVHAAVLLGRAGRPVDVAVTVPTESSERSQSIEPVVSWASQRLPWPFSPHRVLVVSVGHLVPDLVRESDIERYRRATWTLAEAGCSLLDWIETDGDLFRSYAYLTCPATAWPKDDPAHRRSDGHIT
jgi:hypothetical protein